MMNLSGRPSPKNRLRETEPFEISHARRRLARTFAASAAVAIAILTAMFVAHYWARTLPLSPPSTLERIDFSRGRCLVYMANRTLIGTLAEFDDGFYAYLTFDYYRSQAALMNQQVMLTSDDRGPKTLYRILVRLPDDLIQGVNELAELKVHRLTSQVQFSWLTKDEFAQDLHQTMLFIETYSGPVPKTLEKLHGYELQAYLRRFIRFKSSTDPRRYQSIEPVPSPLTRNQASRLAANMIAVSNFYGIPLRLLVGIGAMENNFMNVPGDLNNTAWKRHAQPGDIVLKRGRNSVLVRNDSSGVWQITRQSLRYANRLYLADTRDYSQLPARLRPPKQLDMDDLNQDSLTTYAGLLLRDLLDRFHGDLTLAAGAYNGGYRSPNARYAAGVEMIANYARRVIERAAMLNEKEVSHTSVNNRVIAGRPDG